MKPVCAIGAVKEAIKILDGTEAKPEEEKEKSDIKYGMQASVLALQNAGFVECTEDELAVDPIPPIQMELPLE